MLQALLTPLRARFDLTPRTPNASQQQHLSPAREEEDDDIIAPEDFARDVMVELMRNSVDNLKNAEDGRTRIQVLTEVQRIMTQDGRTKDVFRELDGFLILMSMLSSIYETTAEKPAKTNGSADPDTGLGPVIIVEPEEQINSQVEECARLIFENLSEGMNNYPENAEYFRTTIGYPSLTQSLQPLLANPKTLLPTLSLLLALSFHDFSDAITSLFSILSKTKEEGVEAVVSSYNAKFGTIKRPGAMLVLWNSLGFLRPLSDEPQLGEERLDEAAAASVRFGIFKLLELLSQISHRNQAILSTLGLVGPLFQRFCDSKPSQKGGVAADAASISVPSTPVDDAATDDVVRGVSKKERHAISKLLRRLLDMGATTRESRAIFERVLVFQRSDGDAVPTEKGKEKEQAGGEGVGEAVKLDTEILDIIRFGMKSRWLDHVSLESPAALVLEEENVRGLPSGGFTFMMWLWVSELPTTSTSAPPDALHALFTLKFAQTPKTLVALSIDHEGKLGLRTSAPECNSEIVFGRAKVHKFRWTHVALVHYPQKGAGVNHSIRLFVDGVLIDTLNWRYPRPEGSYQTATYMIGDMSEGRKMSWCVASAYFLSVPLVDDLPRLIHHLGPRYSNNFQDRHIIRFLTYEASTSLNMFLSTVAARSSAPTAQTLPIMKAVRDGFDVPEAAIVVALTPATVIPSSARPRDGLSDLVNDGNGGGWAAAGEAAAESNTAGALKQFRTEGDVFVVKAACLDVALWKIGGAAVALRLVQVANTQHELSRALGVLVDGLRNSWQNSEDMERLRGYEILADILRSKSQLINITGFETLFEFLGLNFRSPEQSTITNVLAYKAIALDFELWSCTRIEIQKLFWEHFTTLLQTSRYRKFNSRQRYAKMGLVRKLLFVLQTDWYGNDMIPYLMDALKASLQARFAKDDAIKPVVSYLAANLHTELEPARSPSSEISRIDTLHPHEKAEQVLEHLVSIITTPSYHTKFASALPLTRICLLLLGDKPSPVVATLILTLIGASISISPSFSRKFELISGWSVLKTVLPYCWEPSVNEAAFDVLLGRFTHGKSSALLSPTSKDGQPVAVCSHIVPAILAALQAGLTSVARNCEVSDAQDDSSAHYSWATESNMEVLVEELMDLHASNSSFRQVFKSQQTTQLFVDGYRAFVSKVKSSSEINQFTKRILEKLTHFGLALALDIHLSGTHKKEILETLKTAEGILNPNADRLIIDPSLVADARSVRQRFASARFSLQVGERTIMKTISRMTEWRKTIQESERKRLRKTVLDLRETKRQISQLYEWTHQLTSERGLWPHPETRLWRLDETEGPYRIRKKMEPLNDKSPSSRVDGNDQQTRDVQTPEADTTSLHQAEVPPWAESYEISATEVEDKQLAEDITDDKHRRVRHELEPGDVIEAVETVARIVGVDSSPGLLIIGRTHIYMLDGLVENDDGEVVDAHNAPKRLFFVPGSIVELDGPQRAQRWSHDQIATYSAKTFVFRDCALEIYFRDSRSLLIVFLDKKKRSTIDHRLSAIISRNPQDLSLATPGLRLTPMFGRSAKVLTGLRGDELATAQRKWQAREISNFTYISILNQISGRTPSDATQYPVFPWVLKDYTSVNLDLSSPESYRDLTKSMGALTPARAEAAKTRYLNLQSVDEEPFHYGTHFSSSMIVCHFLIRLAPFTNMFKTLQGGDWDLPDRLFSDLARAYDSAANDVRGDVRELIPEFFTCPEFLENSSNLDFGVQQNTGERIHDVKLPPWARQDPLLFIVMNRRALESPYVSEHLPAWIDLIWGCKQRDPESLNVFNPLSYEGSVDLESIEDELEREAKVGIIHNFGQTPRKLFNSPHPQRLSHGLPSLPVGVLHGIEEDPHLLVQASKCFKDLGSGKPVRELLLDVVGDKIIPCPEGLLCSPAHPHEQIEWRSGGTELQVLIDQKVAQVIENAMCNCAVFADASNLVTGSSDYTVRLWKVSRGNPAAPSGGMHLTLSHIMRVHIDEVVSVTASRTWSMIVSGSKDGSAAIWDLNRGQYVRSIWHGDEGELTAVNLVAVNESTGYIATCSRLKLCLHTINARPIATLDLTTLPSYSKLVPSVTAIAFHEREYSHLGVLATGGPDGSITLWTWTADGTPEHEQAQWEFVLIRTMKARMVGRGVMRPPSITALRFFGESLCHGEETGKSYMWELPE